MSITPSKINNIFIFVFKYLAILIFNEHQLLGHGFVAKLSARTIQRETSDDLKIRILVGNFTTMIYSRCSAQAFYKFNKIVINVNIPIVVVNIPVLFDLVQPDSDIKTDKVIIPSTKLANPTILGKSKSLFSNFRG